MAAGEPLKSNDRGLLLRNMGNRKTQAPPLIDPSERTQLHIRGGQIVKLNLQKERDARIRSRTPQQ